MRGVQQWWVVPLTLANLWSVWVSTYFTNVIKNEFLTGACDFTDMPFVHMIALICFVYNRGASVTASVIATSFARDALSTGSFMTKVCWYSGNRSVWCDRDKVSTDQGSEGIWFPSVNQKNKYTVSLFPPCYGFRTPQIYSSYFTLSIIKANS